jgi:hypothetical protein
MTAAIDSTVHNKNIKLQSFDKDFWLLRNVKVNIPGVLRIAFTWYQLDDYLSSFWEKLQAAIGNEKSAYEKGGRRACLMKFYEAISPLLEALNAINETNKMVEQTGDKEVKSLAESNLSMPPKIAIQEFCRSFSWDYCKMELWDWLDAAISNDDFYKVGLDRSFLLIEYQCIYSLLEATYLLCTQYEGQVLPDGEEGNIEKKIEGEALIIIRHFFLNMPLKQAITTIQEFYSAWVHSVAAVSAPNEHSEKLMFCEYIEKFFKELHTLTPRPNETENTDQQK